MFQLGRFNSVLNFRPYFLLSFGYVHYVCWLAPTLGKTRNGRSSQVVNVASWFLNHLVGNLERTDAHHYFIVYHSALFGRAL